MEKSQTGYMDRYIGVCRILSMWPLSKPSKWSYYTYNMVFLVMVTLNCSLFSGLMFKILSDFSDMEGVATVIDFATVFGSGIFRYVYMYCRGAKYKAMIDFMNKNFIFQSLHSDKEKLDMSKYVKIGYILSFVYLGGSFFWIIQMSFGPLLAWLFQSDREVPLVFDASYPFDMNSSKNRAIVYASQVVSFLSLGYIYLVIDVFWYAIIILTIGQFDLISQSIRNLKFLPSENEKRLEKSVGACIKQHQLTREFIHIVEDLLTPNVLVDFLHAVLSITFILLDMTIALNKGEWMKAFHLLEYFAVSTIHMFLFDWLGNELVLREEELANAIYDVSWFAHPRELRSKVVIMMIQARHPYRLTGGKFYNMSLPFFVATIKTVFSYFTVLLQLHNDGS